MSDNKKKLVTNLTITALVLVLLSVGVVSLKKNKETIVEGSAIKENNLEKNSVSASTQQISRIFVDLNNLNKSIVNSVAILNLPIFTELKDYSVDIVPEPVGKIDPFAQSTLTTQTENIVSKTLSR